MAISDYCVCGEMLGNCRCAVRQRVRDEINLDVFMGVVPGKRWPETSLPENDVLNEIDRLNAEIARKTDAIRNMLGAFDTPLTRLHMKGNWSEFHEQCVRSARAEVAEQYEQWGR